MLHHRAAGFLGCVSVCGSARGQRLGAGGHSGFRKSFTEQMGDTDRDLAIHPREERPALKVIKPIATLKG